MLVSVPLGVVTWTGPVVAPVGTVAVISDFEATVKLADVPLNVTLVVPVNLFPRMITIVPTLPEVGAVSTKGGKPRDKLKMVPSPLDPPIEPRII